jgi:hypothetical protein
LGELLLLLLLLLLMLPALTPHPSPPSPHPPPPLPSHVPPRGSRFVRWGGTFAGPLSVERLQQPHFLQYHQVPASVLAQAVGADGRMKKKKSAHGSSATAAPALSSSSDSEDEVEVLHGQYFNGCARIRTAVPLPPRMGSVRIFHLRKAGPLSIRGAGKGASVCSSDSDCGGDSEAEKTDNGGYGPGGSSSGEEEEEGEGGGAGLGGWGGGGVAAPPVGRYECIRAANILRNEQFKAKCFSQPSGSAAPPFEMREYREPKND